jgi:hypothetical protein
MQERIVAAESCWFAAKVSNEGNERLTHCM